MAARTATLSGTVAWSNGDPFDGYVLVGIAYPTGYTTASPTGVWPQLIIPPFTKVPITDGRFPQTVNLYFNADLEPPGCRYVAFWYDSQNTLISGPSALFDIDADPFPITVPTLTVPGSPVVPTPPTTCGGGSSSSSTSQDIVAVVYVIDGGGSAITTGQKHYVQVPFNASIVGWAIVADQSGDLVVEVDKVASSPPPAAPGIPDVVTDLISASAPMTLTAAQSASSDASGVATWSTVAVAAWDVFGLNCVTASTVTRATVEIYLLRS